MRKNPQAPPFYKISLVVSVWAFLYLGAAPGHAKELTDLLPVAEDGWACDSQGAIAHCEKTVKTCESFMTDKSFPYNAKNKRSCEKDQMCLVGRAKERIMGCFYDFPAAVYNSVASLVTGKTFAKMREKTQKMEEKLKTFAEPVRARCGENPLLTEVEEDPRDSFVRIANEIARQKKINIYNTCERRELKKLGYFDDFNVFSMIKDYLDAVGFNTDCYNPRAVAKFYCTVFSPTVVPIAKLGSLGFKLASTARAVRKAQKVSADMTKAQKVVTTAEVKDAMQVLDRIKEVERKAGVAPAHRTRTWLVRDAAGNVIPTDLSFVMAHGYMNSPAWIQWFAEFMHKTYGVNVVSLRLAGHAAKKRTRLDSLTSKELLHQSIHDMPILGNGLGNHPVFFGHSTGGLMGFHAAIASEPTLGGVIGVSPAARMAPQLEATVHRYSSFGITGKHEEMMIDWLNSDPATAFFNSPVGRRMGSPPRRPDPKDRDANRYKSTFGGRAVDRFSDTYRDFVLPLRAAEAGVSVREYLRRFHISVFDTVGDRTIHQPTNFGLFRKDGGSNYKFLTDQTPHGKTLSAGRQSTEEVKKFAMQEVDKIHNRLGIPIPPR